MSTPFNWLARLRQRRPSPIGLRLLAFNLLLVFLPVAGILYLDVYERQLLDAQERSMVQQGRVVAAALGGHGDLDARDSEALLARLGQRGDARIRIYDRSASLVADSVHVADAAATDRAASEASSEYEPSFKSIRQRALYRVGAWLARARELLRVQSMSRGLVRSVLVASVAAVLAAHPGAAPANDSPAVLQRFLSLDDPAPFGPEKAIWLEDKLPWVVLDESLPSFPKSSKTS